MTTRLYVVTRGDLAPGLRAAQATHAALQLAMERPELVRSWHEASNNLVLLETPTEESLAVLVERLEREGIAHASFREPDLDDELTAVCIEPAGARLVSSLPLLLRARRLEAPARVGDHEALRGHVVADA